MISKNEILLYMYTAATCNQIIKKYLNNFHNDEERNELKQLIMLQLLENKKNYQYLYKAWKNKEIEHLYARIVNTQITLNESPWNLKYKIRNKDYQSKIEDKIDNSEEIIERKREIDNEERNKLILITKALNKINNNNPRLIAEIEAFKHYYYNKKTLKEVEEIMGINYVTIFKYVKNIKEKIKEEIKNGI